MLIRRFSFTALIIMLIGVWIWLSNLEIYIFNWKRDWPVVLIVLGVYWLISSLIGERRRRFYWKGICHRNYKKERDEIREVLADLSEGKIKAEEAAERIKNIREERKD